MTVVTVHGRGDAWGRDDARAGVKAARMPPNVERLEAGRRPCIEHVVGGPTSAMRAPSTSDAYRGHHEKLTCSNKFLVPELQVLVPPKPVVALLVSG